MGSCCSSGSFCGCVYCAAKVELSQRTLEQILEQKHPELPLRYEATNDCCHLVSCCCVPCINCVCKRVRVSNQSTKDKFVPKNAGGIESKNGELKHEAVVDAKQFVVYSQLSLFPNAPQSETNEMKAVEQTLKEANHPQSKLYSTVSLALAQVVTVARGLVDGRHEYVHVGHVAARDVTIVVVHRRFCDVAYGKLFVPFIHPRLCLQIVAFVF